jgi:serine/threonine protein kinase
MPYFSSGSLNKLMNTRFLTVREIVVFGCQIASGLHNIHSKKLVHFDIKPDNILLSERGEAMIADFGLSTRMMPSGTAEQDRFYHKMKPPEAFTQLEHSATFDIYQFGLTLYRMCNGNKVFYDQFDSYGPINTFDRDKFKFDVRNGKFPDRTTFEAHIPNKLRTLIKRCLKTDPSERYQSAIDVSNALAAVEDSFDWQFSIVGGNRLWEQEKDDKVYSLSVDEEGTSVAKKTINASGKTSRITNYCKSNILTSEIKSFLGENDAS